MKRVILIVLVLLVVLGVGKACIKRDVPISDKPVLRSKAQVVNANYPIPQNITIDGIDYLQSQAPIGNFGGSFVDSTIGEGPKTFNPFNTKDNISSQMSEIMYDGLVTTNPVTGETIPKLAKSFSVNGKEYIVKLRHGLNGLMENRLRQMMLFLLGKI